jgi:hypothetical protein
LSNDDYEDEDYDFDDYEESEETACTIPHSKYEKCPECCDFGGNYQPGTEECDFCPWADVCAEAKYGKRGR